MQDLYREVSGAILWVKNSMLGMLKLERDGKHFTLSSAVPSKKFYQIILYGAVNKHRLGGRGGTYVPAL